MKRESRQHGLVRSYRFLPAPYNPRPLSRSPTQLDSPLKAGIFAKVTPKPTNHSKFTGKCGRPRCLECHQHPVTKAKNKAKGTHKMHSQDVVFNCRLVSWRVVDPRPGFKLSGFSATEMLDHLASDGYLDYYDDESFHEGYGYGPDDNVLLSDLLFPAEREARIEELEDEYDDDDSGGVDDDGYNKRMWDDDDYNKRVWNNDDDGEDAMSFCDVGFAVDQLEEDEDWCLVEEM